MPEHHHKDETYFGEDYYDESAEENSMLSDMALGDPYAQADRLHIKGKENPITWHKDFVDEYD